MCSYRCSWCSYRLEMVVSHLFCEASFTSYRIVYIALLSINTIHGIKNIGGRNIDSLDSPEWSSLVRDFGK